MATFGDSIVHSQEAGYGAGEAQARYFTSFPGGVVSSMSVLCKYGADGTKLRLAIYSDNSGMPGTRLWLSDEFLMTSGMSSLAYRTVDGTPVNIDAQDVWLAVGVSGTGDIYLGYKTISALDGQYVSTFSTFPATWNFSPYQFKLEFGIYAAYSDAVSGPTLTSISPERGYTTGGTSITLTGEGFTGATGVTFGGTAATNVTVVNDTTITCTTPAKMSGSSKVVVKHGDGDSTDDVFFEFFVRLAAPTLTAEQVGSLIVVRWAAEQPVEHPMPPNLPASYTPSGGVVMKTGQTFSALKIDAAMNTALNSESNSGGKESSDILVEQCYVGGAGSTIHFGVKFGAGPQSYDFEVRDSVFEDCRQPILVANLTGGIFERLVLENNKSADDHDHCIYVGTGTHNLEFRDIKFISYYGWGLHCYDEGMVSGGGFIVEDCLFEAAQGGSFLAWPGFEDITIRNCVFRCQGNNYPPFDLYGVKDVLIEDFEVWGSNYLVEVIATTYPNQNVVIRNGVWHTNSNNWVSGAATGITIENVTKVPL